jgi:hypothetical protein
MRQYQLESDRLLSEFRSQKKRAEELEQRNYQLEQRLGESEKLIARLQGRSNSRVADSGARTDGRTLADLGSNPPGTTKKIPGLGLPDDTPGTAGRLTSGAGTGTLNGDPTRSNQWPSPLIRSSVDPMLLPQRPPVSVTNVLLHRWFY